MKARGGRPAKHEKAPGQLLVFDTGHPVMAWSPRFI